MDAQFPPTCHSCGQSHTNSEPHVYDYIQPVDEELTCHICLSPLVSPVDAPCGHTFCRVCLATYLRRHRICPLDRRPVHISVCQPSSRVLKRLLEKLTVRCPNSELCDKQLSRGDLDDHIKHRCPGRKVSCKNAIRGCKHRASSTLIQQHEEKCTHAINGITRLPILEGEVSHIELPRTSHNLGMTVVGGADTPLRCVVIQELFPDGLAAQDGRLRPGDQIIEVDGVDLTGVSHHLACQYLKKPGPVLRLGVYRERVDAFAQMSHHHTEELVTITLHKTHHQQLGIRLSGRRLEPGIFVLEVLEGSTADQDGRLRPGDCILYINGQDVRFSRLEQASHLIQKHEVVTLTVARKRSSYVPSESSSSSINHTRTSSAPDNLCSSPAPTQPPQTNGEIPQVRKEDLEEEEVEVVAQKPLQEKSSSCETLEVRSHMSLLSAGRKTCLLPSPERSPDITRHSSEESLEDMISQFRRRLRMEAGHLQYKTVQVKKSVKESLGMRIGGGINSNEGDTPIYIANIHPQGCVGRSRQIRKGDVLVGVNGVSLVGLTHQQAVSMLKATSDLTGAALQILEGPESSLGPSNFVPSWLYWQQLPPVLQFPRTVVLHRTPGSSLGFSIVGGNDTERGDEPVHILFVVQDSPAAKDGKLRCGDRILAVDGQMLDGLHHSEAVSLLKQASTRVSLDIVSWFGSQI